MGQFLFLMIGLTVLWFALSVLLTVGFSRWLRYQRSQDESDPTLR